MATRKLTTPRPDVQRTAYGYCRVSTDMQADSGRGQIADDDPRCNAPPPLLDQPPAGGEHIAAARCGRCGVMWDLDEFRETVRLFCDHAMVAAHRYWVLTEWGGKSCPEYFIEARITNRLGKRASRTAWASKRIPMNLEIPSDSDLAVVWHRKTQAGKFERDPRLCDLQARSRQT